MFLIIPLPHDFACVNQTDPMLGVSAIVAQCDSVISLKYYSRAWCCVEIMIVQMFLKSYGLVHVLVHPNEDIEGNDEKWILREGF